MSKRVNINIGTIGHVDHGKTTLTAAICEVLVKTYPNENLDVKIHGYDQIDNAKEEKARGITINQKTIQYNTPARHYSHTDCPGHQDYVKNMITGAVQLDAVILVVSAVDGVCLQTEEHILLSKQLKIKRITVFLNKLDNPDDQEANEMAMMVQEEVSELLKKNGYDVNEVIWAKGSALKALNGDPKHAEIIINFFKEIDTIPLPLRNIEKDFLLSVDGVYQIQGRGTVASGIIERGKAKLNDEVEIINGSSRLKSIVIGIESFKKPVDIALAGDNVGILLRGISSNDVTGGSIVCKPGTVKIYAGFTALTYILRKEEGGRNTPFQSNYRPQIYMRTNDVTVTISLNEINGGGQMAMGGDYQVMLFSFDKDKLVAMEEGLPFTIREGGKTIGSGVIKKVLTPAELKIAKETFAAGRYIESEEPKIEQEETFPSGKYVEVEA